MLSPSPRGGVSGGKSVNLLAIVRARCALGFRVSMGLAAVWAHHLSRSYWPVTLANSSVSTATPLECHCIFPLILSPKKSSSSVIPTNPCYENNALSIQGCLSRRSDNGFVLISLLRNIMDDYCSHNVCNLPYFLTR